MRTSRDAPPRDWRWVVGGIGRVLIATGLLMFGFVAYQLWGTGLEYAQAQDRLEDDFSRLLAGGSTATTITTTSVLAPSTVAGTSAPTSAAPTTAPPTTATPVPVVAPGDVMANLQIPSIGVDTYVVSGVQPADLKKGPGHYPDTPQPGQLGNAAIAGHRTTYGQPFFRLDQVDAGDEIILTTVDGRFTYRVTGREVVGPGQADVVATTDPTVARLTLTTCDPKYTATNRLIVYADLDPEASDTPLPAPVLETPPTATLAPSTPATAAPDDPATAAPDDPAVPADTTATTTPQSVATTVAPTVADDPGDGDAGQDGADDTAETADAFAHGWFSDDAAFVQVALWGLLVTAVAVGAWLLSRAVGRNWVGALAGIVPFAVALYFFFQNVNRLLPAAL